MAYDLTNLQNVTNYLSQQRQGGAYIPRNGSLGMPSMGWDGWQQYNPAQTYRPATQGQSPMNAPVNGNTGIVPPGMQNGPRQNPMLQRTGGVPSWLQQIQQQKRMNMGNATMNQGQSTGGGYHNVYDPESGRLISSRTYDNPLSQTLQNVVNYGQQYGANAYQFTPGVNDYNAKVKAWQNVANLTGKSLEEVAQMASGHDLAYWEEMQRQYDQGLHPTA